MSTTVEELSASLVREFLSRKVCEGVGGGCGGVIFLGGKINAISCCSLQGLKMTLAAMDEELPRNSERSVRTSHKC